VVSKPEII